MAKEVKNSRIQRRDRDTFTKMYGVFDNNISLHRVSLETIGSYALRYDKGVIEKVTKKINENIKKRSKGKAKKVFLTREEINLILEAQEKHPKQGELFAKNTLV